MSNAAALPQPYVGALRALLRFAVVMAVVALVIGLSYRESTKKLAWEQAPAGVHVEAVLPLGLVHGHVFLIGTLLPVALAGMLLLARRAGGREVGRWTLWGATRIYMPFAVLGLGLQLVKGYHWLLAFRRGETDLAAIDHAFLGGSEALRYALFGVAHTGLAVGLLLFLVGLWRSLGRREGT